MPWRHQDWIAPCDTFAPGRLKPKNGPLATLRKNCERSSRYALRKPSNTSIGKPPGLTAVLSMIGGTAPMSTAFETRFVPCRPMNRATSPPPVEWPPSSPASDQAAQKVRPGRRHIDPYD